jgi:serine acetyltransferase
MGKENRPIMFKIINQFIDGEEISRLKRDFARRFSKEAFQSNSRIWKWHYYYSSPQYRTLLFYRMHKACKVRILTKIFGFFYKASSTRSGVEFSTSLLGGGVIMPHWGRLILNAESIGNDLYVFHNVTVGNDYQTGRPTIGNNVFIGINSVVLGNIRIGDNVVIGACSFVREDIPSNTLVAGNPAKVIKNIGNHYIQDMLGY